MLNTARTKLHGGTIDDPSQRERRVLFLQWQW